MNNLRRSQIKRRNRNNRIKSRVRSRRRKSRVTSRRNNRVKSRVKSRDGCWFSKSGKLYQPLTIYTSRGCPACKDAINLCEQKGIKYKTLDRKDHEEEVNIKTDNYKYVPVIFNSKGEFIGGNQQLINEFK